MQIDEIGVKDIQTDIKESAANNTEKVNEKRGGSDEWVAGICKGIAKECDCEQFWPGDVPHCPIPKRCGENGYRHTDKATKTDQRVGHMDIFQQIDIKVLSNDPNHKAPENRYRNCDHKPFVF